MMHTDELNRPLSQIVVNAQVEQEVEQLKQDLSSFLYVPFYFEDFLIEHAKEITKAAYIAESQIKYIIIAGLTFNSVVQNSLLKLLEEPPKNIRFILVIPAKTVVLPTILSRMPILKRKRLQSEEAEIGFSFAQFDLAVLNSFVKAHERTPKREAKLILETLFKKASRELGEMTAEQLEAFDKGYRLLELNARPHTVLVNLLMHFLPGNS